MSSAGCTAAKVHVGATGHRFLAEVEKLEAGVRRALQTIRERWLGAGLVVISSLAEGADRLVARIAMREFAAELIVPLPLPAEEYEKDFGTEQSKREFRQMLSEAAEVIELPPTQAREDAYLQAGLWLVDHSDVLIALWDGQRAQGRGGTAEYVQRAIEAGKPVFHILCGNRVPGTTIPTTLGHDQGKLVSYNWV